MVHTHLYREKCEDTGIDTVKWVLVYRTTGLIVVRRFELYCCVDLRVYSVLASNKRYRVLYCSYFRSIPEVCLEFTSTHTHLQTLPTSTCVVAVIVISICID